MKLSHIILTATIAAGAAFAALAPASAMPAERPGVTAAQGDMVQIHDSWRGDRWRDDGDWRGDRGWRDDRNWRRSDWRDDDRRWRRWRAERWEERREWRHRDRDIPFWLYRS